MSIYDYLPVGYWICSQQKFRLIMDGYCVYNTFVVETQKNLS